jgi:aspartate kinase
MKKIVMKFGGTSIGNGEHIQHVANLINNYVSQGHKIVVVVSALESVTDDLIKAAEKARDGNRDYLHEFIQKTTQKHITAAKKTVEKKLIQKDIEQKLKATIKELENVLTGIIYLGELTPKSKDYVLSFGERLSTMIIWGALRNLGLKTQYFTGKDVGIITDSNFGEARPLQRMTTHQVKQKIELLLKKKFVPVITGFIAATQDGEITTLGRGGSDYSATIIAAALDADEVWIWTDVDGLMTSDPEIIPSAKIIPELSFQEAIEMAIFGAKAMHPRALEPAMEKNIPVRIRNTFNPEKPGTLIVKEQKIKPHDIVKAITIIKGLALVNVSGAGMVGTPGTAAKVFNILGKNNINVLMISQSASEANISFILQREMLEKAVSTLEIALLGRGLIRKVTAEDDVCVIAIVGAAMKGTPGVAARVFGAVASKGVNVHMIAQGSSELNISFVVKGVDGEETIRAIHEEFKL